jgi:hypothetical protein
VNLHNFIIRKKGSWDKFKVTNYGGGYYAVAPYFHGSVLAGAANSYYISKSGSVIVMDGKNITISYRDGSPPTKYVYLGMYSEERAKKDKEKRIKVLEKRLKNV